ncbi:MAG: pilus assembly protein PilM [Lachnospiraceae bacterium]|nr:pilus assembly protein PilM [Lachnospiraceae bacterium]
MAERVISVEIGERITRVCETDYKGKGEIYHSFFFETPEDVLSNQSVNKSETFRSLLTEHLEKENIKTKKVVFAFNAMRIGSKEESVPIMKENRLREYIKTNATRFFPVNPDEYQIVYRINGPEGEDMQRVRMYAIALETVQSYEELANFCNLTLVDLELVENGIAEALRKEYPRGNIVNISVEEQNSSITILSDGNIALQRNISYGLDGAVGVLLQANKETDSYVSGLEMMADNCRLHRSFDYPAGEDKTKDDVTEELRYVISNVSRILEYYVSKHQGVTFDTILLTGSGSICLGLDELISSEIGYQVQSVSDAFYTTVTATGNPIGINLKPAKKALMAQGLETLSTAKKFFVGCVVISALLVLIPVVRMGVLTAKNNAIQQKIQSMAQAKLVNDEYVETKKQYDELQNMVKLTETPNDALLSLLGEMEQGLPTEATIQEMTADSESVTVYFLAPNKKVAAKTLEAFRSFDCVRDVSTDELHQIEEDEEMNGAYSFMITCYYEGTEVEEDATTEAQPSADAEEDAK